MDIVNRLKQFMTAQQISSTQFADSCKIPRPTLSQILSGRNKKISDEVIAKIHDAFPRLSVLWLLFGEGSMLVGGNIEISEPQNGGIIDFGGSQTTDDSSVSDGKFLGENLFDFDQSEKTEDTEDAADQNPAISIVPDGKKSIVNIMVFYSDNSFQSFVPASSVK